MTYRPTPPPEPQGTTRSWDQESSGLHGNNTSSRGSHDLIEVARTLAAHGGGAASFDLALDLVLNEMLAQALEETKATGAAVALDREGEMVCRATAGTAPELGIRLETTSGLSGACLQTGMIQQCHDAEDPRVDAEACRQLGVRSILVLPLSDGKRGLGVLEVFSSQPNAFHDRDVIALRVLASRAVDNMREVGSRPVVLPSEDRQRAFDDERKTPAVASARSSSDTLLENWPEHEALREDVGRIPVEEGGPGRTETWTTILSVLVIGVALLLGLALGWRAAAGRGQRGLSQTKPHPDSVAHAIRGTVAEEKTPPGGEADGAVSAGNSVGTAKRASSATTEAPPSEGLTVRENGKVIYRLPPAEPEKAAGAKGATEKPADISTTRLIHRVEPEYPPEARAQQIQGLVTLDVQIAGDGTVRNIAVAEGNPVLGEAAVAAIRQWRYKPYTVDGRPVEMQTRITIRFTLPPA